jgi:hypothetical protein
MQTVTDRFKASLKQSHAFVSTATILRNGQPTLLADQKTVATLLIESGSISYDSTAKTRTSGNITASDPTGALTPKGLLDLLSPFTAELLIQRGIIYPDNPTQPEMVTLGIMRPSAVETSESDGGVLMTCTLLDRAFAAQGPVPHPLAIPNGTSPENAISEILSARYNGFPTSNLFTTGILLYSLVLQTGYDAWNEAWAIAQAAGCDLYVDRTGHVTMSPVTLQANAGNVVWRYDEAINPDFGAPKRTLSADNVPNLVVVNGTNPAAPGIQGQAWDSDPTSPTYRYGPYGEKCKTISEPRIANQAQADAMAAAQLAKLLGTAIKVEFDAPPNPALDVYDTIAAVRTPIGLDDYLLIQKIDLPLAHGDLMHVTAVGSVVNQRQQPSSARPVPVGTGTPPPIPGNQPQILSFGAADFSPWPNPPWSTYWTSPSATSFSGGIADIYTALGRVTLSTWPTPSSFGGVAAIPQWQDVDVLGSIVMPATIGAFTAEVLSRDDGSAQAPPNNAVGIHFDMVANNWSLVVYHRTAGFTSFGVSVGQTFQPGHAYGYRYELVGTNLQARVWDLATSEPTTWGTTMQADTASSGVLRVTVTPTTGNGQSILFGQITVTNLGTGPPAQPFPVSTAPSVTLASYTVTGTTVALSFITTNGVKDVTWDEPQGTKIAEGAPDVNGYLTLTLTGRAVGPHTAWIRGWNVPSGAAGGVSSAWLAVPYFVASQPESPIPNTARVGVQAARPAIQTTLQGQAKPSTAVVQAVAHNATTTPASGLGLAQSARCQVLVQNPTVTSGATPRVALQSTTVSGTSVTFVATCSGGVVDVVLDDAADAIHIDTTPVPSPNGTATIVVNGLTPGVHNFTITGTTGAGGTGSVSPPVTTQVTIAGTPPGVFPLSVHSSGRYMLDGQGNPFHILHRSAQGALATATLAQWQAWCLDTKNKGFTAAYLDFLVTTYTGGNANGTALDGVAPFTTGTTPGTYGSTINAAYLTEFDAFLDALATNGLLAIVDPAETGGWLVPWMRRLGNTAVFNFGAALAARYAPGGAHPVPGILWYFGNDWETPTNATDQALVLNLVNGIKSVDSQHVWTGEVNYETGNAMPVTTGIPVPFIASDPRDTAALDAVCALGSVYSYTGVYDKVLQGWAKTPAKPTGVTESIYEGGLSGYGYNTTPQRTAVPFDSRKASLWSFTSGGIGQTGVGEGGTGAQGTTALNGIGATQVASFFKLMKTISWWNLVPDGGVGGAGAQYIGSGPPTYDQAVAATPASPSATAAAVVGSAIQNGDCIVAMVGWNDATSTISSVVDTAGNTYTAVGAGITRGTGLSQRIYVALNAKASAAGANSVTATFSGAVPFPDLRVGVYTGVQLTGAIDQNAGAAGSSTAASSGNVTTTAANEIAVGGVMTGTGVSAVGAGQSLRLLTTGGPGAQGDTISDQPVLNSGTVVASTATIAPTGTWVCNVVTLKGTGVSASSRGTYISTGDPLTNDWISGAVTAAADAAVIYMPVGGASGRLISFNMGKMGGGSGTSSVQVWDPVSNTTYIDSRSPIANSGIVNLGAPPGSHTDGKDDWVFLIRSPAVTGGTVFTPAGTAPTPPPSGGTGGGPSATVKGAPFGFSSSGVGYSGTGFPGGVYARYCADQAKAEGFGWCRMDIHSTPAAPFLPVPYDGSANWVDLDATLDHVIANGLRPLFVFTGVGSGATAASQAALCNALFDRYKVGGTHPLPANQQPMVEMFNEFDVSSFSGGTLNTPAASAAFMTTFYTTVKAHGVTWVVASGSVTTFAPPQTYINGWAAAWGANPNCDAISIHPYPTAYDTTGAIPGSQAAVDNTRNAIAALGGKYATLPVLCTEVGYTNDTPGQAGQSAGIQALANLQIGGTRANYQMCIFHTPGGAMLSTNFEWWIGATASTVVAAMKTLVADPVTPPPPPTTAFSFPAFGISGGARPFDSNYQLEIQRTAQLVGAGKNGWWRDDTWNITRLDQIVAEIRKYPGLLYMAQVQSSSPSVAASFAAKYGPSHGGGLHAIEIINEPDLPNSVRGTQFITGDLYANTMLPIVAAILQADPKMYIVVGAKSDNVSTAAPNPWTWFNQMYSVTGSLKAHGISALSYHPYEYASTYAHQDPGDLIAIRATMTAHGDNSLQLWCTETNSARHTVANNAQANGMAGLVSRHAGQAFTGLDNNTYYYRDGNTATGPKYIGGVLVYTMRDDGTGPGDGDWAICDGACNPVYGYNAYQTAIANARSAGWISAS